MQKEWAQAFLHSGVLISLDRENVAVGWGKQFWHATLPSVDSWSFYFPDFFLEQEKPWLTCAKWEMVEIGELIERLSPALSASSLEWKEADRGHFVQQYTHAKELMENRVLEKAVPFTFAIAAGNFTVAQRQASLLSCCEWSRRTPLSLYGFWNEQEGMIGATPELLFKQMEEKVELQAVAGTVEANASWRGDAKLQREHQLVVKGIAEALASFGELSIGETELVPYSQIAHLMTPIAASLHKPIHFEQLVRLLHPTPALGAYPREAGAAWLRGIKLNRGRFGAPVGVKKGRAGHCFVAIRNVQWKGGQIQLGAGCGVTSESDFDREWDELQLKIKTIKNILNL